MKKKATKTAKKTKPKPKAKKATGTKRKSGLSQITYALSDDLAAIVGSKKLTRPQVVKQLWVYIKKHKCQDSTNKRMINPDKTLSLVIGSRPVDMLKLATHLNKHIKK